MKKVNVLTAFLSLLVLLSSCAGPLTGPGGTFTLKVNLSQGTEGRTVVPDLGDAVKSYRLNLTSRSGHVPREMVSQGSTLTFESLHAGIWDLQGQALDADGTVLAEKVLTGQTLEASGALELTLALAPTVRTGTGTLDLILQWPESSGVDGLTVSLLTGEAPVADPQPQVIIPTFVAGSSRTAYILRTDLEAGTYSLVLKFTRAGKDAGTFREAVNITADLITRFWIDPTDGKLVTVRTFTAGDFLGAQTNLAGLVVNGIVASDFTFTPETTAYIIPKVPTSKPLTFTATQGMPGQNLEYQWNTEETWQTGVFSALSRPLTLKAGDNKLTLKVTAPDRTNFKTYTLTFHWTPSFVSPTGMEMVQVDGGTFQRDAEATNLSTVDTFLLGRYEVTREQFLQVMGVDPSDLRYSSNVLNPVQGINWYRALVFCNRLSVLEGLTPVYSVPGVDLNTVSFGSIPQTFDATWNGAVMNLKANGYRLPTETEAIWASIGGVRSSGFVGGVERTGYQKEFSGDPRPLETGDPIEDYAWYSPNGQSSRPGGQKLPNELGLFDLTGNVNEWCWDWGGTIPNGPLTNYTGPLNGNMRIHIGGSFVTPLNEVSPITHFNRSPEKATNTNGFRVARNSSPLYKVTYSAAGADADKSFTLAYKAGDTVTVLDNAAGIEKYTYEVNGWTDDGVGKTYLPGDTFIMGSQNLILRPRWSIATIAVAGGAFPQTSGTITFEHSLSPFRMGKYEVTYDQWYKVTQWVIGKGYTISLPGTEGDDGTPTYPPSTSETKNEPATSMNWRDSLVWCNALSEMEGLTPVYYTDEEFKNPLKTSTTFLQTDTTPGSQDNPYVLWGANGYRLPTEGEMYYVAVYQDGKNWTPPTYASGATADTSNLEETGKVGWFTFNSGGHTQVVGRKAPNALGFYDISGNVWEYLWDAQENYTAVAKKDYRGGVLVQYRSIYGGAYDAEGSLIQIGHRQTRNPFDPQVHLGFRIVRSMRAE